MSTARRAENVVEFESVDKAFAVCDRNAALGGYCGKAGVSPGGSGSSMNSGCPGASVQYRRAPRDGRCASVEVDHDVDDQRLFPHASIWRGLSSPIYATTV